MISTGRPLLRIVFFRTGDLAQIDEQGYVRITGRLKDLIIRGGVNISPIPIEDTLARHSDVESVAVIGFPDARLGERICAVIRPGSRKPPPEELLSFCRAQGPSKRLCPEIIRFVDKMPRTAGGKIRKADLRRADHRNRSGSPGHVTMRQRINDIDIAYSESGQGPKSRLAAWSGRRPPQFCRGPEAITRCPYLCLRTCAATVRPAWVMPRAP